MASQSDIKNRPSTLSQTIQTIEFIVKDIPEEKAHLLGKKVIGVVSEIGKFIDLTNLYGITIAINYGDALKDLDLGSKILSPESYTNTDGITGIAKAVTVVRNDRPYTYLVFNAQYLFPLIEEKEDSSDMNFTLGLIAHECAHVQLNAEKRFLPEFKLGASIKDYKHKMALGIAEICWDEYAACLISSSFINTEKAHHISTTLTAIETAHEKANQAIFAYRIHGSLNTLITEAGEAIIAPLRMISYLFGDIDSSYIFNEKDISWSDIEDVHQKFIEKEYFIFADKLWVELRKLWETRKKWESVLVFKNIEDIVSDIFESIGITFTLQYDGQYYIGVL
ncbi:hypothetical protein [Zymomonas mobilis]|uniref:Uncharacterized protein n=1 Tax=Zymomonas mobilis subsp. pomaceae (strain ATCC 29192 / DSM 22645 / JCM 10191 / CCUG 17912 / NBRC 13757 / NCIMB 11200 / NRRL B-4491 / Barker I) TaxID=579138 RepID=F8EWH8_ZYMMT|nr:hypothetical protein [Zymomonas mobilis]AEI38621.1 conserved hypothetical protein [Zymomonas mobilis subsp. pomaceae ATCC 29192]MDX5947810.1 hypothetical protein [Zymomonas mobilis subsp. pomaceae]GEB90102.1 hypothetical protein ZMO02_17390 [Zymomonas mobilis subsp. pomaceae]